MLIVIFNIKFEGYAELDHMWVEEVKHKQPSKVNWKFSFDRLQQRTRRIISTFLCKDTNENLKIYSVVLKMNWEKWRQKKVIKNLMKMWVARMARLEDSIINYIVIGMSFIWHSTVQFKADLGGWATNICRFIRDYFIICNHSLEMKHRNKVQYQSTISSRFRPIQLYCTLR